MRSRRVKKNVLQNNKQNSYILWSQLLIKHTSIFVGLSIVYLNRELYTTISKQSSIKNTKYIIILIRKEQ